MFNTKKKRPKLDTYLRKLGFPILLFPSHDLEILHLVTAFFILTGEGGNSLGEHRGERRRDRFYFWPLPFPLGLSVSVQYFCENKPRGFSIRAVGLEGRAVFCGFKITCGICEHNGAEKNMPKLRNSINCQASAEEFFTRKLYCWRDITLLK